MATPLPDALQRQLRGVRLRLLWVFMAFGVGASLTWYYREAVFQWLLAPARGRLSETGQPIFTAPTEMMTVTTNLAVMGGVVLALPVLVYHVARFLSPLMSPRYRRFVAVFLPASLVCYLAGVAFAYWVLLPTGLTFLLQFGSGVAVPMIRVSEYVSLVQAMLFWLGVVFELPLAMFLLVRFRLVSYGRLKRLRVYVPITALFVSMIITPTTDWVNQGLVAGPIILLYEVGMVLSWVAKPKVAKAA